ncbi:MAG: T9SS type A sorting domain-containing protein [Fibrobacteres bacterium]|nr:T9SS type A sorting domain-containing protein [Fibrobacterota bacterium]
MKQNISRLIICVLLVMASTVFSAAFTQQPTCVDRVDSVSITFAVSTNTDVTVEVLDSAGKVVRHLGTGVLGDNAPKPYMKNSLVQTLFWDKKDDKGFPWYGSYNIRVGLGLSASFDRIFGWNGNYTHRYIPRAMAVDTAGNIIVTDWFGSVRGNGQTSMYDRNGNYIRTLVPYPNNLPEERLKGYGRLEVRGKKSPVFYLGFHGCPVPEYFNPTRQGMIVAPQGWLVMINSKGDGAWYGRQAAKTRLLVFGLDGGCARDTIYGPTLTQELTTGGQLAVTADGKYVYATGIREGFWSTTTPTQVVYKALLDDTAQAKIFKGENKVAGSGNDHFNVTKGIAVDNAGNVYVADSGNSRIVVYDSNGTYITEEPFTNPELLQMNMKTGELYVLTLPGSNIIRVTRFTPLPDFNVSLVKVISTGNYWDHKPVFALDWHSAIPRIWGGGYSVNFVLDDMGDSMVVKNITTLKTMTDRSDPNDAEWPWHIAVDQNEEFLFAGSINWTKINLTTGVMTKMPTIKGRDITPGTDGTFYTWGKTSYLDSTVMRYNKQGVAIAFDSGPMEFTTSQTFFRGPNMGGRGFCQGPNGDFYMLRSERTVPAILTVYDKSGHKKRDSLLVMPVEAASIQVDKDGNLYTAVNVRPKNLAYPDYFKQPSPFLPNPWANGQYRIGWPYAKMNYYLYLIGSLFKFPSTGGTILPTTEAYSEELPTNTTVPSVQINGGYNEGRKITGAEWQYFGVGPLPASSGHIPIDHGDNVCRCHSPRITVDLNGRVVFPDPMSHSVGILDANRNEIIRFGEYGNADQQGPEITFQYPTFVQAVNQSVYVSDPGARRVMRVKLSYTVSATTNGVVMSEKLLLPATINGNLIRTYPVPFNPVVNVEWIQEKEGSATVSAHTIDGRLLKTIASGYFNSGVNRLQWDGCDNASNKVASGVYIIRISAGGKSYNKKVFTGK